MMSIEKKDRMPLWRLIKYFFKPYPVIIFIILCVSMIFVLFETLTTAIVYPLVNTMFSSTGNTTQSEIIVKINEFLDTLPFDNKSLILLIVFLGFNIFTNVFNYIRTTLSEVFSRIVVRDFRLKLYNKYINSDYQYFLDNKQGTIIFRAITAPEYSAVLYSSILKIIVNMISLVAVVTLLFAISFKMTFMMIGIGVSFYLFVRLISKKIVYRNSSEIQTVSEQQNVIMNETVNGIKQIKIGRAEELWSKDFSNKAYTACRLFIKNDLFRAIPTTGLQAFVMFSVLILVIIFWKHLTVEFVNYLPLFGVYFYAFMRLAPLLSQIASMKLILEERLPYSQVVYEELNTQSRKLTDGKTNVNEFREEIYFEDVNFSYPGRDHTLRDISIKFQKGKTTALVGLSGSGKSTLVDLIIRLFDVNQGGILIDGVNIKQIKLSDWLNKIGYVSQDTFVFNSTIRDNISFRDKDVDQETIEKATRIANAHNFIMELPEQYDTVVGDRGLKLSGGQRQRIAIARAILRNPEILIFDEATSSLDNVSESQVQEAINKISENHTVIIVAHRLSTVINSDKIIVFDEGRVVEEGKHSDLIARNGAYSRLYYSKNMAQPAVVK